MSVQTLDTKSVEIDGSYGEGGGQLLRSALTLSLATGKAMHIRQIRARRPKPGLMPQHLKAVEAAAEVGRARVEGADLHSTSLYFEPQGIYPGRFHLEIGTAGSTSLVFQTVYLPLSFGDSPSLVTVTGGTHVPWSPCFHYLQLQWLPYAQKIGLHMELEMESAGFFPKGGGILQAHIHPVQLLKPLKLLERGTLKKIRCISAVANLPMEIAERQRQETENRIRHLKTETEIEILSLPSPVQGTMLLLLAEFEKSQCCYYALGERGKPAERVADEAVDALEEFIHSEAAIDPYLADQLLLPLAFADGLSELRTAKVTNHLFTNAWIIQRFWPVSIEIEGEIGQPGLIRIQGRRRS